MMLSFLATPTRSQKSRSASGVKPRRRRPTIVGIRGSSQPDDVLLDDELQQLALAHHRVGQVQAGELDLLRTRRHRQVGEQPVVERPVILELERAQRVRDLLDGVRDRMGVVVGRIDRPRVAGAVVRDAPHPVEHRVAHVDVRRRHVDLGAQHQRPVLELAGAHPREQVEVLGHRAIAVRAVLARLGERAAILADLVGRQAVDVGQAGPDQVLGVAVERLEVVGGVEQAGPVEPEPLHVGLDRVDVLDVFLGRVGVVEAQVAAAAELAGDAEVQADRLGVADVQVPVRLRRKARRDAPRMTRRPDVLRDDRANEVEGFGRAGRGHLGRALLYRWTGSGLASGPSVYQCPTKVSPVPGAPAPRPRDAPQA